MDKLPASVNDTLAEIDMTNGMRGSTPRREPRAGRCTITISPLWHEQTKPKMIRMAERRQGSAIAVSECGANRIPIRRFARTSTFYAACLQHRGPGSRKLSDQVVVSPTLLPRAQSFKQKHRHSLMARETLAGFKSISPAGPLLSQQALRTLRLAFLSRSLITFSTAWLAPGLDFVDQSRGTRAPVACR
jgi:hypothetical protein